MKKIFSIILGLALLTVFAGQALAVKPSQNLAAAQKVSWNLSGAVMPIPPYGSGDIVGSDTSSKLIVNQPNGNTEVAITGVMSGLNPNTTYTVYLSNEYTKYVNTGWSLNGNWGLNFNSTAWPSGNPYAHALTVTGNTATGTSTGNTYTATVSIVGDAVTIVATYNLGSAVYPYTYTAIGTISSSGALSGTWTDDRGDSGTWNSTSGVATPTGTGSTGWSGLFSTVLPFTFTTDEYGAGSWHLNLKDADFPGTGSYTLSVWINGGGGTILVSDNFTVVK